MVLKFDFACSWRFGFAAITLGLTRLVHASPPINVALQASFNPAPYLLELLETAAEENSTSYFHILDSIADGTFDDAVTEKELYDRFLKMVEEGGHLQSPESISSFKLSLAIRSAAPRIEAHYQYYNTSVQSSLMQAQDAACPVWVHTDGVQYCSSQMERAQQDVSGELESRELPFDRVLGEITLPPAVLYADVASPLFKEFHLKLSTMAKEGQVSYRVRYRPPQHWSSRPLFVSGYGVELALKKTDYIVIDDRDAKKSDTAGTNQQVLSEDTPDDLRPLSSSEVSGLGLSTASFVMNSEDPLTTLLKISQDFPKHSAAIAAHTPTDEFLKEYRENGAGMLPGGYSLIWINGVQIDPKQIDIFSLADHLRRERKLIDGFRNLGLSAKEAVNLLSHEALVEAQANDQPTRYDFRDDKDGGDVIFWMNDLEKDKRYEGWPTELVALLQRAYPGQMPAIRRDVHNIVIPVDLTNPEDVHLITNTIAVFVKRKIPIRFGLVPTVSSPGAIAQLKVVHYLQDTYGLSIMLKYLEESLSKKKLASPDNSSFQLAIRDKDVRADKVSRSFEEVLQDGKLESIASHTASYLNRLGADGKTPPLFVNGVPIVRGENWMQEMTTRINRDLQTVQQGILENIFQEDTWIPMLFLASAFESRNILIAPESLDDIRIVDLNTVSKYHASTLERLPRLESEADAIIESAHAIIIADFETEDGMTLLAAALEFWDTHKNTEVSFMHNPGPDTSRSDTSTKLYTALKSDGKVDISQLSGILRSDTQATPTKDIAEFWRSVQGLANYLGFVPGAKGLILNGRAVGPLTSSQTLSTEDLGHLLKYEHQQRIGPVVEALKALPIESKISTPLDLAKLTSAVALSSKADVPEGIFETSSNVRFNLFNNWKTEHSVIKVSNSEDPSINIVAAIDPASDKAQKWLPMLQVLSRLSGVDLKIFLNPKEQLQELPIKRFYRYALHHEPTFNNVGSLLEPEASFVGIPVDALLTLGMDVPSSWLVAPKESVHDLDNIKLRSVKESSVDAVYELEHILIEGHSRDITLGTPPRGVQLLLGTENEPHFSDTIIMANLGYFQFKAQPGFWKINLKPGRSQRIFNLDSVGGRGHTPQPGDETNEVALLSFQGKTLFPRLSRKKGHEEEDVLDTGSKPGSAMDYVSKGFNFASGVLSSVGMKTKGNSGEKHADINVFSVASGHLYERMLNIMMVSVMRNTKHSVKFWFIEQFLSPSFKSFLPHLAKEYGFAYEMVTYKWPHWLRGQTEKQREIWGYKILFLDVLFPLSLDKVIFIDADQVVRTDMYDLVSLDLEGAPYGFTPMCDSREEMEGFRFWKQGYWKNFLRDKPYHISALYVVDLNRFRALAAGDRLRGQYQVLSADPGSLSNLDQDLPNHMQHHIPIKSLPQEWLWCETWCSDESFPRARTIDLCNNPMTKEPKLDRARRQVPEWTEYDDEIAALASRVARKQEEKEKVRQEKLYNEENEDEEDSSAWDKDEL